MIVAFTGTRRGATPEQLHRVRCLLTSLLERGPMQLLHGDCIGADAQVHAIGLELRGLGAAILIRIYPTSIAGLRARCSGGHVHQEMPPLERNRVMVEQADVVIGTPAEYLEQRRGGTWSTLRFARKIGRRTFAVAPDGSFMHYPARRPG